MQKNKTEILIQKYLSHQLNEQEFEELKQWIEKDASHREIFVKLLSLHHVNNQLNLLHQFDKEGSWKSLQNRCNQSGSIYRRIVVYSYSAVQTEHQKIHIIAQTRSRTQSHLLGKVL